MSDFLLAIIANDVIRHWQKLVNYCRYPSLRVAYIDEVEDTIDGKSIKNYYSVLVKGGNKLDEVGSQIWQ